MTAPTTRPKPKIALDQRAASRHDGAYPTLAADRPHRIFTEAEAEMCTRISTLQWEFSSWPLIYQHAKPPSTSRSTPVTKEAAGLSRKIAGPTISSTVAMRAIGVSAAKTFNCSATSGRLFIAVSV